MAHDPPPQWEASRISGGAATPNSYSTNGSDAPLINGAIKSHMTPHILWHHKRCLHTKVEGFHAMLWRKALSGWNTSPLLCLVPMACAGTQWHPMFPVSYQCSEAAILSSFALFSSCSSHLVPPISVPAHPSQCKHVGGVLSSRPSFFHHKLAVEISSEEVIFQTVCLTCVSQAFEYFCHPGKQAFQQRRQARQREILFRGDGHDFGNLHLQAFQQRDYSSHPHRQNATSPYICFVHLDNRCHWHGCHGHVMDRSYFTEQVNEKITKYRLSKWPFNF